MLAELRDHVAKVIGKIARPQSIVFTDDLPKTRSGKIMRRLLRDIAEGRELGDVTTLQNAPILDEIATERDEITVAKVNADDNPELAMRFNSVLATPGFDVWVGGGLSTNPMFAKRLGVFVRPHEVVPVVLGITTVFRDWGYRRARNRARLKFLVQDWGPMKFREVLEKEIAWWGAIGRWGCWRTAWRKPWQAAGGWSF